MLVLASPILFFTPVFAMIATISLHSLWICIVWLIAIVVEYLFSSCQIIVFMTPQQKNYLRLLGCAVIMLSIYEQYHIFCLTDWQTYYEVPKSFLRISVLFSGYAFLVEARYLPHSLGARRIIAALRISLLVLFFAIVYFIQLSQGATDLVSLALHMLIAIICECMIFVIFLDFQGET